MPQPIPKNRLTSLYCLRRTFSSYLTTGIGIIQSIFARFSRIALPSTEMELSAIAAPAIMGLR